MKKDETITTQNVYMYNTIILFHSILFYHSILQIYTLNLGPGSLYNQLKLKNVFRGYQAYLAFRFADFSNVDSNRREIDYHRYCYRIFLTFRQHIHLWTFQSWLQVSLHNIPNLPTGQFALHPPDILSQPVGQLLHCLSHWFPLLISKSTNIISASTCFFFLRNYDCIQENKYLHNDSSHILFIKKKISEPIFC